MYTFNDGSTYDGMHAIVCGCSACVALRCADGTLCSWLRNDKVGVFYMVAGEFKDGWMHGKGIYTVKGRVGGAQDASGKAGVHVFEGDYLDGARDGQVFASAPACLSATRSYTVLPDVERYGKRHRMPYNRHRKQR